MALSRRTVLLVDDDPEFCEIAVLLLGEAGFHVEVAAHLMALKALLTSQKFDVAVVDLMLPDRGGVFTCQMIREFAGGRVRLLLRAPIVDVVTDVEVQAIGASDFIVTPYFFEDLVERIANLCSDPS